MDFGTIKNTFTQILIESHVNNDEKGKELYKKFLSILKESETLKSFFIVYKNIEGKTINSEVGASDYLKESLSVLGKFRGNKSIVTECKKLVTLLKESEVEISNTPSTLHESLHKLTTTSKNINTLDVLHESKGNIVKWLMEDKTKEVEDKSNVRENIDVQKFLSIATEKYNEKYSDLTEEEKNIIKVLREGTDDEKELLLRSMIKEAVSLVNNKLQNSGDNITLKSKLLETKDVIYNMDEYNVDTFGESITKLYDIKSILG